MGTSSLTVLWATGSDLPLQAAVLPVEHVSLGVASPSGVNRLQLQTRLAPWSSACSC